MENTLKKVLIAALLLMAGVVSFFFLADIASTPRHCIHA